MLTFSLHAHRQRILGCFGSYLQKACPATTRYVYSDALMMEGRKLKTNVLKLTLDDPDIQYRLAGCRLAPPRHEEMRVRHVRCSGLHWRVRFLTFVFSFLLFCSLPLQPSFLIYEVAGAHVIHMTTLYKARGNIQCPETCAANSTREYTTKQCVLTRLEVCAEELAYDTTLHCLKWHTCAAVSVYVCVCLGVSFVVSAIMPGQHNAHWWIETFLLWEHVQLANSSLFLYLACTGNKNARETAL